MIENELSPRETLALAFMLEGRSTTDIAAELGVDRSTVHRMRGRPRFASRLVREREALAEDIRLRLGALAGKALSVVDAHLGRESLPAAQGVMRAVATWFPPVAAPLSTALDVKELSTVLAALRDAIPAEAWPAVEEAIARFEVAGETGADSEAPDDSKDSL